MNHTDINLILFYEQMENKRSKTNVYVLAFVNFNVRYKYIVVQG